MDRNRAIASREKRVDVRKPALLINSDGMEIDILVLDVSSHGFRIELDDQLRVGELVSLKVDDELIGAEIRWVLGKEAGGTFIAPVDSKTL
jgi:hypothetical protein